MIAAIRIRGRVKTPRRIDDTLKVLRLGRVNNCVLLPKEPSILGMLEKAKDYIAWGEISKETLVELLRRRLRLIGSRRVGEETLEEKLGLKSFEELADLLLEGKRLKDFEIFECAFRLRPPKRGYKSIKEHWPRGDLGYRGEKINELLERMI